MAGVGQSTPGITSSGSPIATGDAGGVVVSPTTSFQFTGAVTVTAGGPGEVIVNIGAVGTFANTNLNNLTAPVEPNLSLDFQGGPQTITGLPAPIAVSDAATKAYVDAGDAGNMQTDFSNAVAAANAIDLGAFQINNLANPTLAQDAATKDYVDNAAPASKMDTDFGNAIPAVNAINMGGFQINNMADPILNQDAATKFYVDNTSTGWSLLGNTLVGGEFLGSLNAIDVVMIYNNIESAKLTGTGIDFNQGGYNFEFAAGENRLYFGNQDTGGVMSTANPGSFAHGSVSGALSVITSSGIGSSAFGQALLGGQIVSNAIGALTFGNGNGGSINAANIGCLAFGSADDTSLIQSNNLGATAFGSSIDGAIITSSGEGSLSFGRVTQLGSVQSSGNGSLAFGYADNAVGNAIAAGGVGSLAFGQNLSTGGFDATNTASFASGMASGAGQIRANEDASFARGSSAGNISVTAGGLAGFAYGVTVDAASSITSTGASAFAIGQANNGSNILSSSAASFAFGNADNASTISASGPGAFAIGNATAGFNITCSAVGFAGGAADTGDINTTGSGGFTYGDDIDNSATVAQAFGIGHSNTSFACMIIGEYGITPGATPGSSVATDPTFVIGNGVVGVPANSFRIDKDGRQYETGAISIPIRSVTTSGAVSDRTDRKIVLNDGAAGANTLTLPAGTTGLTFTFSRATGNTGTWALAPSGGDTIDADVPADLASTAGPKDITFLAGVWYYI